MTSIGTKPSTCSSRVSTAQQNDRAARSGRRGTGVLVSPLLGLARVNAWVLGAGLALSSLLLASSVAAQAEARVITLAEITIVGRVQKPVAAVDVSRLQPKLTLSELRKPFVYRIELVVRKDPF